MRTITYVFVDKHRETIEVDDSVAEVYEELLKYEKKVNRKETRRHVSLEKMLEDGFDFPDPTADIEYIWEQREKEEQERELLRLEQNRLDRQRESLETKLTPRQAEAYFMFKYLKMKKVKIAEEMGVTEGAVRKLVLKAEENLEKYRQKELEERKEKKRQKRAEQKERKKVEKQTEEMSTELRLLKAIFGEI